LLILQNAILPLLALIYGGLRGTHDVFTFVVKKKIKKSHWQPKNITIGLSKVMKQKVKHSPKF
jgi:hypothetical protein